MKPLKNRRLRGSSPEQNRSKKNTANPQQIHSKKPISAEQKREALTASLGVIRRVASIHPLTGPYRPAAARSQAR